MFCEAWQLGLLTIGLNEIGLHPLPRSSLDGYSLETIFSHLRGLQIPPYRNRKSHPEHPASYRTVQTLLDTKIEELSEMEPIKLEWKAQTLNNGLERMVLRVLLN